MSDRKVHFSVPIHQIEYLDEQWETASRLARDGSEWSRMGVDRQRFRDRIERTADLFNRIFDFDFRQQIYQERFENFVIPDQQTIKSTTTTTTTANQTIAGPSSAQQESEKKEEQQPSIPSQQQSQSPAQAQYNKRRRRNKRNNNRRKSRGGQRRKK